MARGQAMLGATLLLLAACSRHEDNSSESAQLNAAANIVEEEDASPDSLTAPDNMAVDGESSGGTGNE